MKVLTNKSSFSDSKYVDSFCTVHFLLSALMTSEQIFCFIFRNADWLCRVRMGGRRVFVGMQISDTKYQTQMHHLILNMSISHPCLQRNLSVVSIIPSRKGARRREHEGGKLPNIPTDTSDKIFDSQLTCVKKKTFQPIFFKWRS